ncbi:putative ubiquitin hydrolase putative cysteine peptidase Clan CA family C19 [Leptomonas seymouri]|uniref:Putative ubiquitin hydrolase putative cysteine peptidase Clan CA family C19 n=1 Tax=Leptomonas seymouri TaxID=5684 RepID=A0A0N1I8R9_LEPSE|nr:putative ubiquitin hydrolase putative cysteine peptidase Clan CA family C19 [Leptomonas seymouri]|eukprot:KPI90405.1 putative ubiquitin hydrolase putative cysteine peptidase Clan CA family C19 [Leptomonas seymouri]
MKASSNGSKRQGPASFSGQSPEKKSGSSKSTFGSTLKKLFSSSKNSSKTDLSGMASKSVSSAPMRESSLRLISAEEEELSITPRTEKELYLCVTCGCCYCRDHACDHHYSRRSRPGMVNGDLDAPDKGYPYHSFFIGVPSYVSTHPSHILPETSWGLLFPTVTIPEVEGGTVDLTRPVPFYTNFDEICDASVACGGGGNSHFSGGYGAGSHSFSKGKLSTASSFGNTRALSAMGSSVCLDSNGSPLLHQKVDSSVSLKDDAPEKTLLGSVSAGNDTLSPPSFHSTPPERWSYLMFCAKCADRQAMRLQGKSCDNDVPRQCHLRRLGQLTAVLAYFLMRGVRLELTPEFVAYTTQKHAQQVERQRQQLRGFRAADVQRVGRASEAGATDLPVPKTTSTIGSSPTLANVHLSAGWGLLSRTETDHVITCATICGFSNKSYFCYMNSVVQCLLRCRNFTRSLLQLVRGKSPGKLTSAMVHLMRHISHQTYQDVRNGAVYAYMRALHSQISSTNSLFAADEQQDAQEFLITLLNGIEDEFDKGKSPEQKSETRSISFEGTLLSEVSCSRCQHRVPRNEMFMSLSIPIEKSIEKGLASLFTTATLTGKDRYACEECFKKLSKKEQEAHNALAAEQAEAEKKARAAGKKLSADERAKRVYANSVYREAEVCTSISRLGRSLAVNLLRFHYDIEAQDFIKNMSPVKISLTLDLTPYVTKEVLETYRNIEKVELLLRRFPTASSMLVAKYLAAANNDVKAATRRMVDDNWGVLDAHSRESSGCCGDGESLSPNCKGDTALTDEVIGSNMDGSSVSCSIPVTPVHAAAASKDKADGSSAAGAALCKSNAAGTAASIYALTRDDFDPFGERQAPKPSLVRQLVGIVAHRGSLHGGHYIAYVRHLTQPHVWFRCDDEDIDVVEESYVLDHEAEVYLAFYE